MRIISLMSMATNELTYNADHCLKNSRLYFNLHKLFRAHKARFSENKHKPKWSFVKFGIK